MPNLDDHLRRELKRAARQPDPSGLYERLARRKSRRGLARRAQVAALGVAVVAGTVTGTIGLNRVFRPSATGGQVAFVRTLRDCPGYPNVGGPEKEIFAVDVVTGELRNLSFGDGAERFPDFSPDGTKYVWTDQYREGLFLTDLTTGVVRKLTHGVEVGPGQFSPDGTKIALGVSQSPQEIAEGVFMETAAIHVMNSDGTGLTRLTFPESGTSDGVPLWSPDGSRIAFARTHATASLQREGDLTRVSPVSTTTFHVMNADGTGLQQVAEAPSDLSFVDGDWSPDGSTVVGEVVRHGNHDLYALDLDSRTVRRLTDDPAGDRSPSWSPDGSMIAFLAGKAPSAGRSSEVAVMNADGTGMRRLTDDCWADQEPVWIPDPSTVAAMPVWTPPPLPDLGKPGAAESEQILFSDDVEGITDLYAINPDGSGRVNITADLPGQLSPAWSPRHAKIAFAGDIDEPGNLDIYVMNADGSGLARLTNTENGENRPSWSPDGSAIVFESDDGIWTVNADGSDLHRLAGGSYPAWSPDGSTIAFVRGASVYICGCRRFRPPHVCRWDRRRPRSDCKHVRALVVA